MTNKAAINEMMSAHEAMASVLDQKFKDVPEWQAFRAIDRALIALNQQDDPKPVPPSNNASPRKSAQVIRQPASNGAQRKLNLPTPYFKLAEQALDEVGRPVTTPDMIAYVGKHRKLADLDKAKINITSSLSKHSKFKSVAWENGKAWWWADRPVPKRDMASLLE